MMSEICEKIDEMCGRRDKGQLGYFSSMMRMERGLNNVLFGAARRNSEGMALRKL
jgi:hypothetical protein